jgi:hypothetical protein
MTMQRRWRAWFNVAVGPLAHARRCYQLNPVGAITPILNTGWPRTSGSH